MNTQFMNLDLIRTFVIVGQSKDLSDAASKLKLDLTNVSRHIKALEEIMGTKLLNRNSKGYELTESGQKLFEGYEKAYNMLMLTEKNYFQEKSINSGKLTIGVSSELEKDFVIEIVALYKKKYPNVNIKIVNMPTKKLFERLSQYYLDFVIDTNLDNLKKSKEIRNEHLFDDNYCIAYNSEFFTKEINEITELKDIPLILPITSRIERKIFDKLLEDNNINKNLSLEFDNYDSGIAYLKLGLGYCLLPKRLLKSSNLKIFDLDMVKPIYISYIYENLSESAKEFLQEFKNIKRYVNY